MEQNMDLIMGTLGVISILMVLWIIAIHTRVNRLKKEIEELKKVAYE